MERIKHRVTHYWSHRAEGFEAQRLREFESEKKDRWLAEFRKYLPQGRPLRVLDIGTGTGFFACLMAEEGHQAIGIDLTPEMIDHAEHMAAVLGLDAQFQIMDAEETDFASESFDVLEPDLDAAPHRTGLPGVVPYPEAGRGAPELRRGLLRRHRQ